MNTFLPSGTPNDDMRDMPTIMIEEDDDDDDESTTMATTFTQIDATGRTFRRTTPFPLETTTRNRYATFDKLWSYWKTTSTTNAAIHNSEGERDDGNIPSIRTAAEQEEEDDNRNDNEEVGRERIDAAIAIVTPCNSPTYTTSTVNQMTTSDTSREKDANRIKASGEAVATNRTTPNGTMIGTTNSTNSTTLTSNHNNKKGNYKTKISWSWLETSIVKECMAHLFQTLLVVWFFKIYDSTNHPKTVDNTTDGMITPPELSYYEELDDNDTTNGITDERQQQHNGPVDLDEMTIKTGNMSWGAGNGGGFHAGPHGTTTQPSSTTRPPPPFSTVSIPPIMLDHNTVRAYKYMERWQHQTMILWAKYAWTFYAIFLAYHILASYALANECEAAKEDAITAQEEVVAATSSRVVVPQDSSSTIRYERFLKQKCTIWWYQAVVHGIVELFVFPIVGRYVIKKKQYQNAYFIGIFSLLTNFLVPYAFVLSLAYHDGGSTFFYQNALYAKPYFIISLCLNALLFFIWFIISRRVFSTYHLTKVDEQQQRQRASQREQQNGFNHWWHVIRLDMKPPTNKGANRTKQSGLSRYQRYCQRQRRHRRLAEEEIHVELHDVENSEDDDIPATSIGTTTNLNNATEEVDDEDDNDKKKFCWVVSNWQGALQWNSDTDVFRLVVVQT